MLTAASGTRCGLVPCDGRTERGHLPSTCHTMGGLRVIWRIRGERQIIGHPARHFEVAATLHTSLTSRILVRNSLSQHRATQARAFAVNTDSLDKNTRTRSQYSQECKNVPRRQCYVTRDFWLFDLIWEHFYVKFRFREPSCIGF